MTDNERDSILRWFMGPKQKDCNRLEKAVDVLYPAMERMGATRRVSPADYDAIKEYVAASIALIQAWEQEHRTRNKRDLYRNIEILVRYKTQTAGEIAEDLDMDVRAVNQVIRRAKNEGVDVPAKKQKKPRR